MTAIIKVRSSSTGGYPVLLKIYECPMNGDSPITLLSEYQIREYGLVIDSVAKKHKSSHGKQGTQRFEINSWVHIDFEDRGGLMGFEILPMEDGDEDKYETFTITSPEKWNPHKFQNATYHASTISDADTKGSNTPTETPPTPLNPVTSSKLLNAMTYEELTGQHKFNCEHAGYPAYLNHEDIQDLSLNMSNKIDLMDPKIPAMDTSIYATTAWHRVIHKEIDPRKLRPFLGFRPKRVIRRILEKLLKWLE